MKNQETQNGRQERAQRDFERPKFYLDPTIKRLVTI